MDFTEGPPGVLSPGSALVDEFNKHVAIKKSRTGEDFENGVINRLKRSFPRLEEQDIKNIKTRIETYYIRGPQIYKHGYWNRSRPIRKEDEMVDFLLRQHADELRTGHWKEFKEIPWNLPD